MAKLCVYKANVIGSTCCQKDANLNWVSIAEQTASPLFCGEASFRQALASLAEAGFASASILFRCLALAVNKCSRKACGGILLEAARQQI